METNKKLIAALVAALAMAGSVPARAADEDKLTDEQLLEEGLTKKEDPYEISAGLAFRAATHRHNALQQRSDRQNDNTEDWRDGNSDGNGFGFVIAVERGSSRLQMKINATDYDYTLDLPNYEHRIDTERRDFDLEWQERSGQTERGNWGWSLGVRAVTLDERVSIREKKTVREIDDGVDWLMAQAGYWGNLRPFGNDVMRIYGFTHLLIGEADGITRDGSDLNGGDGAISETYDNGHSVAYGLNGGLGAAFRVHKHVGLGIEYYREWLYSFDSTDSGIVVFPDNDDALFIENTYGLNAYLTVHW